MSPHPGSAGSGGLDAPATPTRSRALVRRVLRRAHGHCERCNVRTGTLIVDHVVPLALGGADDEDNMQAVCKACDALKTPSDIRAIKKADRIRAKAAKPARKPQAKRYRGVDGKVRER